MQLIVLKELTVAALREDNFDSCIILWACWQKCNEASSKWRTVACMPCSHNEFLLTRLITLSEENRNMQLPWQHASKHRSVPRESSYQRRPDTLRATMSYFLSMTLYSAHSWFINTSHIHKHCFVRVCVSVCVCACIQSLSWESSSSLTPNNVTIVAPGAANLGVSLSVSNRGLTIPWMGR